MIRTMVIPAVAARRLPAVALLLLLQPVGSASATEEAREALRPGERTYRVHCMNCHGERGAGDGPLAALLTVPAADLRLIAARRGGSFPEGEIHRIIDGREEVRGHGLREMPVWGLTFQERGRDVLDAGQVRGRIRQLVHFLRSLQVTYGHRAGDEAAEDSPPPTEDGDGP